MPRVQLALNVSNIDRAVEFYSRMFSAEPAKRMPGYANFAIVDPPLKLVLIETGELRGSGMLGALNHLGVEVESASQVHDATREFSASGMEPVVQESTTCCFAVQDKAWVHDPDGAQWEVYTVLGDTSISAGLSGDGTCCGVHNQIESCC